MAAEPRPLVVAVTGAGGYVGAALCRHLVARGHAVRGLSRRAIALAGVTHVPYDLRRPVAPEALAGVDVVVHAAAETARGADPDAPAELAGLKALLDAAGQAGARVVFVSSQTARPDAPTGYGRLKAQAEAIVLARGGLAVRPGQVYGGPEQGLWGALAALARRAPLLPRFLPEPVVQPIHVDDLAAALTALAVDRTREGRVYLVADPAPIAFSRFLQAIAENRFGRSPPRLPIPLAPIFLAARLARRVGVMLAFAGRLKSLADLPILDSAADMAALGLPARRFPAGLDRSGRGRRPLLREGAILLRHLLGTRPSAGAVRRYARTLARLGETQPLALGAWPRRLPVLLAAFDQPNARARAGDADMMSRRIDLALLIAESSPAHADGFLLAPGLGRRAAQTGAACAVLLREAAARLIDLALGPRWLDRIRPRAGGAGRHDA